MIAIDRAKLDPTMRRRARADRSPPNTVARSSSATSQSFSESSNVPSMSNSTPCSSPPMFRGLRFAQRLFGTHRGHITGQPTHRLRHGHTPHIVVIRHQVGVHTLGDLRRRVA